MKLLRVMVLVGVVGGVGMQQLQGQVPTRAPVRPSAGQLPGRPDTLRTKADSLRAGADTLASKDTVARANFTPPDSVMQRLLGMPGYTTTQYQGATISFDAISRAIELSKKAIVRSSSSTIEAGSSPARILQKMQSASAIARKA